MKTLLRGLFHALVRLYYPTITIEGAERVPAGAPVLFVLNHPNGLLDPLVLRLALGREVRFLAKSTFFKHPLWRLAMDAFGAIPVYRRQDPAAEGGGDPSRNDETFELCRAALGRGEWIALFPEGTTHSDPRLRPLKTGAARIALSTEARHDGALGLTVLPVGLTYEQKATFRTRALVAVGTGLDVRQFYPTYLREERAAVEALTEAIREGLGEVVLQADTRELLEGIARVATWTLDEPVGAGGRGGLAEQHRRTRVLLDAYRRLEARDPARVAALVALARRYMDTLRALGVRDPWALEVELVRPAAAALAVARLAALAPFAAVGAALGWVPYRLAGRVAPGIARREEDVLGTTKLLVGALFVPVAWIAEAVAVGAVLGWPWALALLAVAPATGYAALRFEEQLAVVTEGARYLWLRGRHGGLAERLAVRRRELADEVAAALREAVAGDGDEAVKAV